jgi:hypothetical protein
MFHAVMFEKQSKEKFTKMSKNSWRSQFLRRLCMVSILCINLQKFSFKKKRNFKTLNSTFNFERCQQLTSCSDEQNLICI